MRDQEGQGKERDRNRERDRERERPRRGKREKRDRELVFTIARSNDTRWPCSGLGGVLNGSKIVWVS